MFELLIALFLLALIFVIRVGGKSRQIAKTHPEYGRPIFGRAARLMLILSLMAIMLLLEYLKIKLGYDRQIRK
jgi:hypothetical protein